MATKEKTLKWTSKTAKEPYEKQLWEEQSPTNGYKEQLRRMVLIEEGPS